MTPFLRAAALALFAALAPALAPALRAQTITAADSARVESLLARMTLEEKVGEMTQLTIQAVSRVQGSATVAHQLDSAKLEEAIVGHNVGSLLNVWDAAFTPQHWAEVTGTIQRFAARRRLPIPVIYGIDAVHGQNYMVGATIFPQNLAMAATWNPALVRESNRITAIETRAGGISWNFSPVLDLGRQPLWSRFFETFGEDVHLATTLGVAAVEGLQEPAAGRARVAATGKHFLGYSVSRSGRDRTTAWIPDRQLREYILPPFAAAIDAGMLTIMVNSGDINGEPVHASRRILTNLLRGELGFRGIAVTDWEDIVRLHTVHRVAPTRRDAVRMAVMAGIDMSMVPYNLDFHRDLVALVREGAVPMARIDESVRRILRVKAAIGLFESAAPDPAALAHVGAAPSRAVSRASADEAITLLKNDRALLPLAKTTRLLVTGPGATSLPVTHGSWTYTWQGTDTAMYPKTTKTVLDALRAEFGASRVAHVPGATIDRVIDIPAAVAAARAADVAIVVLAEWPSTEKPGDIDDLALPAAQLELARAIEATGKPVVLILFENRPRIIRPVVDSARAIVMGYQTGPYAGEALADILTGDVNPSGRLPFSYPRHSGAIVHYDRAEAENITPGGPQGGYAPEWEFGHGLSYTTFGYSGLRIARSALGMSDTLVVSVMVANTGSRAGKEVVQLYVRDLYASITPAVRRLRGFEKVSLAPGERRDVTFRIPVQALGFVGLENRRVVEPGDFEISVGGLPAVPFRVEDR